MKRILFPILLLALAAISNAQDLKKYETYNARIVKIYNVVYSDVTLNESHIDDLKSFSERDSFYWFAQNLIGICYYKMEKKDEAIEQFKKLLVPENKELVNTYEYLADYSRKSEKYTEALTYCDEGLKKFPRNTPFLYIKAMTLKNQEKWVEAEKAFIEYLKLNPFSQVSHFQLAEINVKLNRYIPAMFCYQFAVLINPQDIGKTYYVELEKLCGENFEPRVGTSTDEVNKHYQQLEQLVRSDLSNSKDYKLKTKLTYKVARKTQLLLEGLQDFTPASDFYASFYLPFYQTLAKESTEAYIYYLHQGFELKEVNSWKKKNMDEFDIMINTASKYITQKQTFGLGTPDYSKVAYSYHGNGVVASEGYYDAKNDTIKIGSWVSYNDEGMLSSKGKYENNERVGKWEFFVDDKLESTEEYENGKVVKYATYSPFGYTTLMYGLKDGKLEGELERSNQFGALTLKKTFKDNNIEGASKVFYVNGQLATESNYTTGKLEGKNTSYYADGKVKYEFNYVNDEYEGPIKTYYHNGQVKLEASAKAGKYVGTYKEFYGDGKIKVDAVYDNEGNTKSYKAFYPDGALQVSNTYDDKGEMIEKQQFDVDGKIYLKLKYKKDEMQQAICYDKQGKEYGICTQAKGRLILKTYDPFGNLQMEGEYEGKKMVGTWKYYKGVGYLYNEITYSSKGEQTGEVKFYHPNGKLSSISTQTNGVSDGESKAYYPDGSIYVEGTFNNDEREGVWKYYYPNGKIQEKSYYRNGEFDGPFEEYTYEGKLERRIIYVNGLVKSMEYFNENGDLVSDCQLKDGTGKLYVKATNGKKVFEGNYLKGLMNDSAFNYLPNGAVTQRSYRLEGKHAGKLISYNDFTGVVQRNVNYVNGKLDDGAGFYYHPNGKLQSSFIAYDGDYCGKKQNFLEDGTLEYETNYIDGEQTGYTTIYAPTGEVAYRYLYSDGDKISYSYLGKDNKFVPEIPFKMGNMTMTAYYSNGQKSTEMQYTNGEINGKLIKYYPNGKVMEEMNLPNNNYEGTTKEYYPDGTLRTETNFVNDERHGVEKEYYPNGKLKFLINYSYGSFHGLAQYYDQTGKLKVEIVYSNGFPMSIRKI